MKPVKLKGSLLTLTDMRSMLPLSASLTEFHKIPAKERHYDQQGRREAGGSSKGWLTKQPTPENTSMWRANSTLCVRVITFPLRALLAPPFIPAPHDAEEGPYGQSSQAQWCHMDRRVATSPGQSQAHSVFLCHLAITLKITWVCTAETWGKSHPCWQDISNWLLLYSRLSQATELGRTGLNGAQTHNDFLTHHPESDMWHLTLQCRHKAPGGEERSAAPANLSRKTTFQGKHQSLV